MELRTAKAAPKDAAMLAATRQKVWAATYRGIYPDDMIDNFDYAWHTQREKRNLQNPMIHTYLVMDGDEYVGYFTYFIKKTPLWRDYHVRLFSLYLLPEYQGLGFGRKFFRHVAEHCRRAGYDRLYLSCAPQNKKAMDFYVLWPRMWAMRVLSRILLNLNFTFKRFRYEHQICYDHHCRTAQCG